VSRRRTLVWSLVAALASVLAAAYVAVQEREAGLPRSRAPAHTQPDATEPTSMARRPLRIGWTAWADAEWVTRLVARLVEERVDQPVELVMADVGLQYQGLASGDLDVMLMAWLPVTHADYYDRVSGRVIDLGPIYTGARLGWAVPDYVPRGELGSIADLRKDSVRERLNAHVVGIDPGSGLMRASRRVLQAYGLKRWSLMASSSAGMVAELDRAIRQQEWVVVTAWNPHWIFARYELRYLDDPLGVLGRSERVHALAREGFDADFPLRVLDFLTRLDIPVEEVERALLVASERSVDEAVDDFLEREPARVDYWVTGEIPSR
jgi:glycine betaine/proline transport system substrate-binding protein